jgi:hypothetical protein
MQSQSSQNPISSVIDTDWRQKEHVQRSVTVRRRQKNMSLLSRRRRTKLPDRGRLIFHHPIRCENIFRRVTTNLLQTEGGNSDVNRISNDITISPVRNAGTERLYSLPNPPLSREGNIQEERIKRKPRFREKLSESAIGEYPKETGKDILTEQSSEEGRFMIRPMTHPVRTIVRNRRALDRSNDQIPFSGREQRVKQGLDKTIIMTNIYNQSSRGSSENESPRALVSRRGVVKEGEITPHGRYIRGARSLSLRENNQNRSMKLENTRLILKSNSKQTETKRVPSEGVEEGFGGSNRGKEPEHDQINQVEPSESIFEDPSRFNQVVDHLYDKLEDKMRIERERRGIR